MSWNPQTGNNPYQPQQPGYQFNQVPGTGRGNPIRDQAASLQARGVQVVSTPVVEMRPVAVGRALPIQQGQNLGPQNVYGGQVPLSRQQFGNPNPNGPHFQQQYGNPNPNGPHFQQQYGNPNPNVPLSQQHPSRR